MHTSTVLLSLSLALFGTSTPVGLAPRAGGPTAKPIPANCTISNPVLCTSSASCPPVSYTPYRPTSAALGPDGPILYAYYLQPDSFQVTSGTPESLMKMCLETCFGYGNTGNCKAVYQAYGYPTPPMFGGPGGDPSVACLMFSRALNAGDFEVVPEDSRDKWTDPRSGDIVCPAA